MFECKYKIEEKDCVTCAKYVYKSQKRKQDKIIAVLIPILFVAIIAMLIYNACTGQSVVWEIIMAVALVVLEAFYLLIPVMLVRSQKKSFKQQKLDEIDYLQIIIDGSNCVETLVKNEKEIAKNVHGLRSLTSYLEDSERLVLVFNKVEFVCIRKSELTGGLEKLKAHLEKMMSKSTSKK